MSGLMKDNRGFTLVEAMVAFGLTVLLFLSLMAAFLSVNTLNIIAKHNLQGIQVVRGEIERLKSLVFTDIEDRTANGVSFDAGPDHDFTQTGDNLTGTLTVQLQDFLDMDLDNNQQVCASTTCFDLDGDAAYDSGILPVRVSFTWQENIAGQNRNFSVFADTLIAQ